MSHSAPPRRHSTGNLSDKRLRKRQQNQKDARARQKKPRNKTAPYIPKAEKPIIIPNTLMGRFFFWLFPPIPTKPRFDRLSFVGTKEKNKLTGTKPPQITRAP